MKKRILIYDDDSEILMVCKIILEKNGYDVETKLFCDNIISDIGEAKPDIVFMDLWIPTIGGENAINLMKNDSATRHIPVILFSANAEIEMIANRVNADGFLAKPFNLHVLIQTVEDTLGEKQI